jgi:Domain of unknown function (DUF5753)/Helix-turn-helix domain
MTANPAEISAGGPGDAGPGGGPTILRMLLGQHLKRLRESAGVTREDAGWEIRASESKISRMEGGKVGYKERDIADLLSLYGVDDAEEREHLLTLARQANAQGWWHRFGEALPSWFQSYLGMEAAAAQIRTYELQFVPGLLQTREYARAVMLLGHEKPKYEELERRVELRVARQQLLSRPEPLTLWAVIDEAVLHRPIGGGKVMRAQLEALIESTAMPNVRLQIMPFRAGGHAAGQFTLLRFPDKDIPDVVFVEQFTSALYLDKRDEVDAYAAAMESLCVAAEPPDKTAALLEKFIDQHRD